MYGAVATLWESEFQSQTVRWKKLVAKYSVLEFCQEVVEHGGPWLLCGMDRAREGISRAYGHRCFSFCRVGRGKQLCGGTQVMASQRVLIIPVGPVLFNLVRYLLHTHLAERRCTISTLQVRCAVGGSHTVLHYSTWGLTSSLYAAVLRDWDDTLALRFRTVSVEIYSFVGDVWYMDIPLEVAWYGNTEIFDIVHNLKCMSMQYLVMTDGGCFSLFVE